jgi:hypothetical protein
MKYKIGQTWVGEAETRVITALPLGLVYFQRIGTQGALRALHDHATYIPYGPAFCSPQAFSEWVAARGADLEEDP